MSSHIFLLTYALQTNKGKTTETKKAVSLVSSSPGQFRVLHARSSRDGPTQFLPPLLGDGFVQLRLRSCWPVPQLLLHVFHELQVDQPPSTKTGRKKIINAQAWELQVGREEIKELRNKWRQEKLNLALERRNLETRPRTKFETKEGKREWSRDGTFETTN